MPTSDPTILLRIAGAELPVPTHHGTCTVQEGRHPSGRRTLSISAAGWLPPALSGVTWSTTPVELAWRELGASPPTWRTLTVWSKGPQITADLLAPGASWTLEGVEAAGLSALVTIGGTAYWARVDVAPIEPAYQVKSNGATTLLRAWTKHTVRLSGEGGAAPAVSGLVAVASTLYTGNILCGGVTRGLDPATGLVTWSIEGREP